MQPLFRNDVFLLNDVKYRVVHIDRDKGKLYGYPIDDPSGLPIGWEIREITLLHTQKRLKLVADQVVLRPLAMSPAAAQALERRWATVSELIEKHHGDLMERDTRGRAIAYHAEKVRVSDRHLMKLLRKLWRLGLNKSSLQSDFHNCGRVTADTVDAVKFQIKTITGKELVVLSPASQLARGRRPVYKDYIPYSYPKGLKELLVKDIRAWYLKDETVSIRSVQDKVLKEYFSLKDENGNPVENENGSAFLRALGERPSNAQILYLIKKTIPEHDAFSNRVSAEAFNNNVARSDGTVHDDCVGPGDVYEIDATIVDLILVSKFHRGVAIGKATLYLVVDRDTNLIVGFHLCLNKPSWEGAKRAILSISSDWEALCKALGVKYRPGDWPAQNTFPNRFFTDRGEGISEKSNVVVLGPGVEVTTAPKASPRRKCRVEGNFFYTIGVFIKEHAGGYEPPGNQQKRRAKKYDKDMRYNLDEAASVILRAIIQHNHLARASGKIEPHLVYEGFKATPLNLWNYRVSNSTGLLSRTSFDEMRQKLLPLDVAKMTQDGIQFRGLNYKFAHQRFSVLCALASRGAKIELSVQYDTKVDHIWVSEKGNPKVQHLATLTSHSISMEGATWAEVSEFQKAKKVRKHEDAEYNQALRIGHSVQAEKQDTELGRLAKEASKGVPRATSLRVGVEARKLEMQQREAAHVANPSATSMAVTGFTPLPVEEGIEAVDDVVDAVASDGDYGMHSAENLDSAWDQVPPAAEEPTPPNHLGPSDDLQYLFDSLDGSNA